MTEKLLQTINALHPLQEKDVGEFATLKVKGMHFTIQCWTAEGLGHVSLMRAKGMLGLMKMDTLIVNPRLRDLPLFSYDRIFAMGNDTLLLELYDTTLSPFICPALDDLFEEAKSLPERDPGTHWYDDIRLPQSLSKKGKAAQTPSFDRMAAAYLDAWLHAEGTVTDPLEKQKKTNAYVKGLLKNGGPSTDVFMKKLGQDRTTQLFRNVLFGTEGRA